MGRTRIDTKQDHIEPTGDDYGANEYITQKNGKVIRKRSNATQESYRIQKIVTWLMEGIRYTEIVKRGQEEWGLSARPVEVLIRKAREQQEAVAATEIKAATTLAIHRMMDLYDKAVKAKDYKTALDIIKTQNRMLGLNAPDKIEAKSIEGWDSKTLAEQFELVEKKLKEVKLPN